MERDKATEHEPVASGDVMNAETRSGTPATVAVSASESHDVGAFGLSAGHLRDVVADIALEVLAADMDLAYGGDLREHGLTQLLFNLVVRYTRSEEMGTRTRITNHLAWPVHIAMPVEQIECLAAELRGTAELVLVGDDGTHLTLPERRGLRTRTPRPREWVEGLTAMRRFQRACTDARVVLGGQVAGYKGCMPGVAEEALLSLRAKQPLLLVGGFGGAARDVAETLGLAEPWRGSRHDWAGQSEIAGYTGADLNNGLSREENETLATTPFISQIVVLILRGLKRLSLRRNGDGEQPDHA